GRGRTTSRRGAARARRPAPGKVPPASPGGVYFYGGLRDDLGRAVAFAGVERLAERIDAGDAPRVGDRGVDAEGVVAGGRLASVVRRAVPRRAPAAGAHRVGAIVPAGIDAGAGRQDAGLVRRERRDRRRAQEVAFRVHHGEPKTPERRGRFQTFDLVLG